MEASGRSQSSAKVFRRECKSAAWTSLMPRSCNAMAEFSEAISANFLHSQSLDGTQLRQFRNDFSCAHVLNLTCDGRFAKSNSCLAAHSLSETFEIRADSRPLLHFNTAAGISPSARAPRLRTLCAASNPIFLEIFVSAARN